MTSKMRGTRHPTRNPKNPKRKRNPNQNLPDRINLQLKRMKRVTEVVQRRMNPNQEARANLTKKAKKKTTASPSPLVIEKEPKNESE